MIEENWVKRIEDSLEIVRAYEFKNIEKNLIFDFLKKSFFSK